MKIKITELIATAEDLKASRSISETFYNILRQAFNFADEEDEEDKEDEG